MHVDAFGVSLGLPFDPAVVVFADHLLFLGVDADHRFALRHEGLGQAVQIAELAVAVWMGGAFFHLGRRLQRVAQPLEDPSHSVVGDLESLTDEIPGQLRGRLRRPTQQRHRITTSLGID